MQAKVSEEPESMLWSELEDRQLRAPERQLLDAIANGQLDQHLVAIADAVHARRELLHTVRSAGAIAQFCVGETVMFNANIRPRYLQYEAAGDHGARRSLGHGAALPPRRPVRRWRITLPASRARQAGPGRRSLIASAGP
jgi:hypothetical protein